MSYEMPMGVTMLSNRTILFQIKVMCFLLGYNDVKDFFMLPMGLF